MQEIVNGLVQNSSFGAWDVVLAVVVLVVGWFASVWARRGVVVALAKWSGLGPSGTNLVARLVRYSILLLTIGIVLTVLGAPLQPVLAAVIIISAVAFLALRGIAANFGAGLVIQARRPVRIGDSIEVEGVAGRIVELTGRAVLLTTSDGRTIRIPNTMLLENPLWNASESGSVRSEVRARLHGSPDLDRVCPVLLDAVASVASVASVSSGASVSSTDPEVFLHTITPAWADITIRFWSAYDDREAARSSVVRAVAVALGSAGLTCSVSSDGPRFLTALVDAVD
ncbi:MULTISPECIES: mechanosensitive ion channel family protein [unclassified Curtobacterium]|uniref:mechanosensitive ion channel family protein n=1 Tax=unclassified Curtobacterium TaxID=257496 RepID=UPI000F4675ED|nr:MULTISPECIES: mechanosensitive ion channel domain-containing protein [unclassified Curtobacterium]ROQ06006.1 mechanosensitive ion channel-like protein [Curtobacterium sp. PhB171]ROQ22847.1 mechanosensitive ion channel-like protein [Curtobacterium sp. PhB170]ROS34201.1 mechanosensitive ion channel-like protein [Curtobacterium sp. PhB131]ROS66800.1 mechanosensitive ion channel-like protein [Curtobacterium sp. PhB141]